MFLSVSLSLTFSQCRWHDEFHEDTDEEPSDDDDGYESDRGGDGGLQDSHPFDVIAEAIVEESYEVDESSLTRAQVSFGHTSSGNMPLPPPHPHAHPSTSAPEVLFPIGSPPVPLPMPVGTTRSSIMEEAFRRAQEASYTAGYWTAVYQMHASQQVRYVSLPSFSIWSLMCWSLFRIHQSRPQRRNSTAS